MLQIVVATKTVLHLNYKSHTYREYPLKYENKKCNANFYVEHYENEFQFVA